MTKGPTRETVHPYRSSSCRNNLQQKVAPRRQGLWDPSLSRNGVFGAPSAVGPLSLRDASPGGRRPLTHSPQKEVVSGPAHTEGAHPTASGRLEGVALIEQTALLTCGSWEAVSLGCQPGSSESAPLNN